MNSTEQGGHTGEEMPEEAVAASRMRPFSRALPINMLRAREAMMKRFRPVLQARGITEQQWRIIRVLADLGSAEILYLSELCVIHPASLSRILPKMEEVGYIERRTNAADKRRVIVSLSDSGRALFDAFGPESEAVYASIEKDIGPERMRELYGLLDHMIDVLAVPARKSGS